MNEIGWTATKHLAMTYLWPRKSKMQCGILIGINKLHVHALANAENMNNNNTNNNNQKERKKRIIIWINNHKYMAWYRWTIDTRKI